MVIHNSNTSIGDYICIRARNGEEVTVTCSNGSFSGVVHETPDDVPVEENQTKEVLLMQDDDDDTSDALALYAQVTKMTTMRAEYDVYAVLVSVDGDTEDFGEIHEITVEE